MMRLGCEANKDMRQTLPHADLCDAARLSPLNAIRRILDSSPVGVRFLPKNRLPQGRARLIFPPRRPRTRRALWLHHNVADVRPTGTGCTHAYGSTRTSCASTRTLHPAHLGSSRRAEQALLLLATRASIPHCDHCRSPADIDPGVVHA